MREYVEALIKGQDALNMAPTHIHRVLSTLVKLLDQNGHERFLTDPWVTRGRKRAAVVELNSWVQDYAIYVGLSDHVKCHLDRDYERKNRHGLACTECIVVGFEGTREQTSALRHLRPEGILSVYRALNPTTAFVVHKHKLAKDYYAIWKDAREVVQL